MMARERTGNETEARKERERTSKDEPAHEDRIHPEVACFGAAASEIGYLGKRSLTCTLRKMACIHVAVRTIAAGHETSL